MQLPSSQVRTEHKCQGKKSALDCVWREDLHKMLTRLNIVSSALGVNAFLTFLMHILQRLAGTSKREYPSLIRRRDGMQILQAHAMQWLVMGIHYA